MTDFEHSPQLDNSGSVVIVDDNPNVRQMTSLALRTAGFDVVEAAIQIDLQRWLAYNQPDALVNDLTRPEADGLGLLVRMRARPALRDVPTCSSPAATPKISATRQSPPAPLRRAAVRRSRGAG